MLLHHAGRRRRTITLEFDDSLDPGLYSECWRWVKRLKNAKSGMPNMHYLAELDQQSNRRLQRSSLGKSILGQSNSNRRSPGLLIEERAGFTNLLAKGFTDTFRHSAWGPNIITQQDLKSATQAGELTTGLTNRVGG